MMASAIKEGWNEGKAQGIKEGKTQGIKEGYKKGRKEGCKEAIEETAKKLLIKGVSINIISECTGLSVKEIQDLN